MRLPKFLESLAAYDGEARTRLALLLMVLTFARTTELRAARWSEFENLDGNEPLWRIPAERTKMKREHIVPLAPRRWRFYGNCAPCLTPKNSPFCSPRPLAKAICPTIQCCMRCTAWAITAARRFTAFEQWLPPHLMKWVFRPDVIERQLAHQEKNAVRAAYNRAEYFAERRAMMKHWANRLGAHGWRERHFRLPPKRNSFAAFSKIII